jgi:hypothetical protein
MPIAAIVIAVVLLIIVPPIISIFGRVRRLLAPSHFVQIADATRKVRDEISASAEPKREPAHGVTLEAVVLGYSVKPVEATWVHHLSLSRGGAWIAQGFALPALTFIFDRLGLDHDRAAVFVTPRGILHAELSLSTEEHEAWKNRSLVTPTEADVQAWFVSSAERCARLRERVRRVDPSANARRLSPP